VQETVIQVDQISKQFDKNLVLQNISLSVQKGELLGILGPNGSGKTTLIKILSTILKPDSGDAFINELDILKYPDKVKYTFSIVPQEYIFYEELTALENLLFFGTMHHRSIDDLKKDSLIILTKLGLNTRHDKVKNFSGGMKRRLNIAISLVMKTNILFLDEPTTGLDPGSKHATWDYFIELKKQGKTIILLTHDMYEAEFLCDRIIIIDKGIIIANGPPKELISNYSKNYSLELTFKNQKLMNQCLDNLHSVKYKKFIHIDEENKIIIYFAGGPTKFVKIIQNTQLVDLNYLTCVNLRQTTLEDVFLQLTGRRLE